MELSGLRHEIKEMKHEEKQLRWEVQQAYMIIGRRQKDIDNVMNERDILGTQLVRRNDELSLQYSRIKVCWHLSYKFQSFIKRALKSRILRLYYELYRFTFFLHTIFFVTIIRN